MYDTTFLKYMYIDILEHSRQISNLQIAELSTQLHY